MTPQLGFESQLSTNDRGSQTGSFRSHADVQSSKTRIAYHWSYVEVSDSEARHERNLPAKHSAFATCVANTQTPLQYTFDGTSPWNEQGQLILARYLRKNRKGLQTSLHRVTSIPAGEVKSRTCNATFIPANAVRREFSARLLRVASKSRWPSGPAEGGLRRVRLTPRPSQDVRPEALVGPVLFAPNSAVWALTSSKSGLALSGIIKQTENTKKPPSPCHPW
jgi:hypothetical protein